MTNRFYVTTPIYYINDVPHLGSAYTTIAADVLARYHRLRGEETRFLTGTDEHGLKIQRVAAEKGLDPQVYADGIAEKFRATWPRLGCAPDDFIRTTEPRHQREVQKLWTQLMDAGHIYLGHYEGLYCVACEAYYTEKDLLQPGNLCPQHKKAVEVLKEESYFFRLKALQDRLLAHYEAHPDFVRPAGRFNEVKSFVKDGLQDLSVSRTTFNWGIPVPGDPRHVMFVWFDALSNYLTALKAPEDNARFWPSAVHLVGKDILRQHAVYWPAMLLAAGLPLPHQIFAHGFLTYCGEKMSKSLRNTISPVELAETISPTVGVDTVRYSLMRAIAFGQDGDFSIKDVLQRYESELGNTLGNLLNRVLPFTKEVLPRGEAGAAEAALLQEVTRSVEITTKAFDDLNPTGAINAIFELLARANTYINDTAPWIAKNKGDLARVGMIMAPLLVVLEVTSVLLAPVMPSVAATIREQLGLTAIDWTKREALWPLTLPVRPAELVVKGGPMIFPRFEPQKIAELIKAFSPPPKSDEMTEAATASTASTTETTAPAAPAEAAVRAPIEAMAPISYDDFAKLDLRVGIVVSAEKVKKKDKLLDLRVDTGDAAPRRIVAGLAAAYTPEQILGKRVVVLCNLAPRDFGKGLVSEGMILAASDEASLKVLGVDGEKVAGAKVS
ncbi:MAG: methionine--tRNA ligase [Byssovorax sp.]